MNAAESGGVTISDQVVSAHELAARLDVARAEVAAHHGSATGGSASNASDRARRLHLLWATTAPPILEAHAGVRGLVAFNLKRVVRKLGAWYVEPRWQAQREIDAELARFASDSVAAIERLERDVEHLQLCNERLQRELRMSQRREGGSA
jgi:hypothetical protein